MSGRLAQPLHCVHYLDAIRLEAGGVVRAVLDLCEALARGGTAVTLLTSEDRDLPSSWGNGGENGPRVRLIDAPRGRLLPPRTARRLISETLAQADLLHLHTPWDPANRYLARAARGLGVPYVVTVHGMLDDWSMRQHRIKKRTYLALAGRRLLEQAAAVHCTAEAEEAQARQWFPRGRSVVVPYLFNAALFRELPPVDQARAECSLPTEVPIVLFLSRLHPKKGVEQLLDSAALARDGGAPFQLVIAGSGEAAYEDSIRRRVADLDLGDRVRFTGFVDGRKKRDLYRAADLFVLPTSQENFGLVLIEAMACGTPVVTTRGVDIWREIEAAGATIVPGDAASIAEAVPSILNRPDMGSELGQQGRRWVMDHFEQTQSIARYQALYSSLARNQDAPLPNV